ncbi:MAG: type 4a pilus biogenesis protein PilO [Planctomycetaceae bacterium]
MNGNRLLKHDLLLHGLGLMVTLGLVALAIGFVGSPLDRQQEQLQAQIVNMESLLEEQAGVEQTNRKLQADIDRRSAQWNELLNRIPPESQVSEFLTMLTELAEESRLNVEFFNPGVSRAQDLFEEIDIDLQATGDYVSICGFLNGLNTMARICNISKLEISALTQIPDQYTVTLSLRILYNFDDSPAGESSHAAN